ncbi:MAG: hypothetical protein JOZ41_13600, partial [Chloroflexi bacterium]|nr:hypothetical protein [Chloroflexota bacterium]
MAAGYLRLMRDAPTPYAAERERRLEAVLRELERRFGPWVVYRLRDARPAVGERVIASGALSLDLA